MNTKVEWILLITDDYKRMKAFYQDILSFTVKRDVPEEEFTQFALANCFLAIYGKKFVQKLLDRELTGKPGSAIYSFAKSDDVDLEIQQWIKKI